VSSTIIISESGCPLASTRWGSEQTKKRRRCTRWQRVREGCQRWSVAVLQGESSRLAPPHVLSKQPCAAVLLIITSGASRDGDDVASTKDGIQHTRSTPVPRRRVRGRRGPAVG